MMREYYHDGDGVIRKVRLEHLIEYVSVLGGDQHSLLVDGIMTVAYVKDGTVEHVETWDARYDYTLEYARKVLTAIGRWLEGPGQIHIPDQKDSVENDPSIGA